MSRALLRFASDWPRRTCIKAPDPVRVETLLRRRKMYIDGPKFLGAVHKQIMCQFVIKKREERGRLAGLTINPASFVIFFALGMACHQINLPAMTSTSIRNILPGMQITQRPQPDRKIMEINSFCRIVFGPLEY